MWEHVFSTLKGMTGEHEPKRSCGRRLTCYKKAGTLKLSKTGPQILAPPQPAVRPWPHFVPVQMKLLLYRIENELMYAKDSARRLDTVKLKKRFLSEWGQPRESGNCCPDRASVGRGNAKVFSFIFSSSFPILLLFLSYIDIFYFTNAIPSSFLSLCFWGFFLSN